eukprot:scaffold25029_cov75-Phaeocystis_antarctica.AAC.2
MPCESAMRRKVSTRFKKPLASSVHIALCRNTRTALKFNLAAHPNSREIVASSNVSAWNISNWFDALLGKKLAPWRHCCLANHSFARLADQRGGVDGKPAPLRTDSLGRKCAPGSAAPGCPRWESDMDSRSCQRRTKLLFGW